MLVALGAPDLREHQTRDGVTHTIRMTGPAIFGLMIWVFYLRFTVPILGVFYGTSLMADEVEDKTITYLFTRPIRRGAVLLGQVPGLPRLHDVRRAAVGDAGLPADRADATARSAASFIDLLKDLALLALGLAVYGAVFAFIGAKFKRPLLIGLIFIFGWEQAALAFPGYLKKFTVAYYLQGLVPHAMPNDGVVSLIQGIFRESPTLAASLFWLAVIWVVFLALAAPGSSSAGNTCWNSRGGSRTADVGLHSGRFG